MGQTEEVSTMRPSDLGPNFQGYCPEHNTYFEEFCDFCEHEEYPEQLRKEYEEPEE